MSRFAQPAHDNAPSASQNQFDGRCKLTTQAISERNDRLGF
jgi:hypothetical protein